MPKTRKFQKIHLRSWRKYRDLTQDQLADRMLDDDGNRVVDRSYISMVETGKAPYSQVFLEKAAEALGCEPADLIVRDPLDPKGYWTIWDNIPVADRPAFAQALEALKHTLKKAS